MRSPASPVRAGATALAFLLLTGCATTGDPNRGGLFGWRESKARERQRELVRRDDAAWARADGELARNERLRDERGALDTELERLREELNRLGAENRALDAQLRTLIDRRALGLDEKRRLDALLADNAHWLAAAAAPAGRGDVAAQRVIVEQANRRNDALHRELVALLQD